MLGAIKRRWKSKKAKVLQKGGDLPIAHDTCGAASRGFVDEEFEKIIKPPSPRQIHPVSETTMEVVSTKYNNHSPHAQHHLKNSHPTAKIKSSTLPSSEDPGPFIRVNSGRIELVNSSGRDTNRSHGSPHYHLPHPPFPEILSEKLRRRLGGRFKNDNRHSWCGGSRDAPGRMRGSSGLVLSSQPQAHQDTCQYPGNEKQRLNQDVDPTYSDPIEENQIIRLRTSLLQERLDALETLTKNCQNWQKEEKQETKSWITDLTSQVTRATTFQQTVKSEVEKLQERVLDLESHNRAMATMIIPTLMKLQESLGKAQVSEGSAQDQIKTNAKTMAESWSPTTSSVSSQGPKPHHGVKDKKIDCRIPRINYKLNRSKYQEAHRGSGDSSSSPDLTPSLTTSTSGTPCKSAMPKSKSSCASTHSKSSPAGRKASTFSGIPRIASPRPAVGSNGASNHKNDSPKPPSHDLHNNTPTVNNASRLPILRKNVFPSQSSSKSPKTNLAKVTSVIHHQLGSNGGETNKNSTSKSSPSSSSNTNNVKPLGKDEGYSTMSSEALAEQEGSSNDKDITTTIPKSNTFSTFHHHNLAPTVPLVVETRGGPVPKQLIMMGRERNWTSLPKPPGIAAVTQSSPGVVHIVRGISGAVCYDVDAVAEETSSTVLWEDSDDSDILFLPVELSTASPGSTSPTLVPSSWPSSSATPRLPSSTSFSNSSTQSHRNPLPPAWAEGPPDEEKALIEKWMRLEDGRNQVHWEDEWAWDWDGVQRIMATKKPDDDALPEFWSSEGDCGTGSSTKSQIDSSTWTKSKKVSQYCQKVSQNEPEIIEIKPETPSPPPVIEFTPAYYHLVKYSSNSSVNQLPKALPVSQPKIAFQSCSSSEDEAGAKMDDKISQTDFGSSMENLSVSSELFTECRNCLELIKRLVGGIDEAYSSKSDKTDNVVESLDHCHPSVEEGEQGEPTAWISVPTGLPSSEVDRILEILSSSESEDVLSPQSATSRE